MRRHAFLRATLLILAAAWLVACLFFSRVRLYAGEGRTKLSDAERSRLTEHAKQLRSKLEPLYRDRKYKESTPLVEELRDLTEKIYCREDYPKGHLDLARCYTMLSILYGKQRDFDRSQEYAERTVAMYRSLYPTEGFPKGCQELAASLKWQSRVFVEQGKLDRMLNCYQEILAIRQKLYPPAKYPQGHPELTQARLDVAQATHAVAMSLFSKGKFEGSRPHYEQALKMYETAYSTQEYPRGHANVANALTGLGDNLFALRKYDEAREYHEQALAMCRMLYPKKEHPQGHPEIAKALRKVASDLDQKGRLDEARGYLEQALATYQTLYPANLRPEGHPEIVAILIHIASNYSQDGNPERAQEYAQTSMAMCRNLYPKEKYPKGSLELASNLTQLDNIFGLQGNFEQAAEYSKQALAMYQSLFPKEQYPAGDPLVQGALASVASNLAEDGRYESARQYAEQSLAMCQSLYPQDKYPRGHPALAGSWQALAGVLSKLGQQQRAIRCYEQAIAIWRLHPQQYLRDSALIWDLIAVAEILWSEGKHAEATAHRKEAIDVMELKLRTTKPDQEDGDLFRSLGLAGTLSAQQGQFDQAQRYCERALSISQRRYPKVKYPLGHRDVASSLSSLGMALCLRGQYDRAIEHCQQALTIYEALYPRIAYPDGHPDIAFCLTGLGAALAFKQDFGKASAVLKRSAEMEQSRAVLLLSGMSEADALNAALVGRCQIDALLDVWRRTNRPPTEIYSPVWIYRGMVQRVVSSRQRMIQGESSPETRKLYEEYVVARQELARLALSPVDSVPKHMAARQERLVGLGKRKEDLERTLSERVPGFRDQLKNQSRPYTDLVQYLPADSVFADVVLYAGSWIEPGVPGITGVRSTPHYLVFLLSRGEPVACVNLGPAKSIGEAVFAWYQDISAGRPGKAVSTVRDLVWEPIKKSLPKGTRTIFICPDGALSAIPWGAIPGSEADSVLLDAYTFMFVPHGQFLLEQMTARPAKRSQDGVCLAVGNVDYDEKPSTAGLSDALVAREAILTNRQVHWPPLPGTKKELEELDEIAPGKRLVKLTGSEASAAQVLSNLPKARWAHFGTHGFLASPEVRTAMRLDEALFDWSRTLLSGQRLPIGARNPLLMSGLVLAGANLAPSKDEFGIASGQSGILTSEVIAGLPLQNLDLAVLSACETAMGGAVVGEGVFGLQRAFHIAGARNVIGTLWKVDDQATAALMRLFYHKLWVEGKSPIVALRESQLAIYRHPKKLADLATTRGPEFAKVIQGVSSSERPKFQKTAPTKTWAAFILSGAGR